MKIRMLVVLSLLSGSLPANELQLKQFQAGNLISAGEMNGNFSAVKSRIEFNSQELQNQKFELAQFELDIKELELNGAGVLQSVQQQFNNIGSTLNSMGGLVNDAKVAADAAYQEAMRANQRIDNIACYTDSAADGQEYQLELISEGLTLKSPTPLYLTQCPLDFIQQSEVRALGQTSLPVSLATRLNQSVKDEASYQVEINTHLVLGFEGYCVATEVAGGYLVSKSEFNPAMLLQQAAAEAISRVSVVTGEVQ